MTKYLFLFLLLFSTPSFAQDTLIVSKSEIKVDSSAIEEVKFKEGFQENIPMRNLSTKLKSKN